MSSLTSKPTKVEPLQAVRYSYGQYYQPHYDAWPMEVAASKGGNRNATIFLYLNELPGSEPGGGTAFPFHKLRVKPKAGAAILWTNLKQDGAPGAVGAISDCRLSEGAAKNRTQIPITHRLYLFSALPSLGDWGDNRILPYRRGGPGAQEPAHGGTAAAPEQGSPLF